MSIFTEVKSRVSTRDALAYLNIPFKIEHGKEGEQLRCPCPRCKERDKDKRGLSINTATGKFQCFVCHGKGNDIISLVHWAEDCSQTEAANRLKERYCSAARSSSATEPRPQKVEAKGRGGSANAASPLQILGISEAVATRLNIVEEDGCLIFEQRDEQGVKVGLLAVATRDDLPLIAFTEVPEEPKVKNLQELWRVVKGKG